MVRHSQAQALNAAVSARIEQLKVLPVEQLVALGYDAPRTEVVIDGHSHDLDVWSEPIRHQARGLCVVIARLIERHVIGSTHYVQGFVLRSDGHHVHMTERELWQYD